MNMDVQNVNVKQEDLASLRVLEEIEKDPGISQRELSRRVGVSLGLTNLLIGRMARKAWIKIKSVPGRRLLYALTPRGLAEKFRKTRDFLRLSLRYYGNLKQTIVARIRETKIERPGVAVHGAGDLAELVQEAVREAGGHSVEQRPQVVVVLEKPPRDLKDEWQRRGIAIVDLT